MNSDDLTNEEINLNLELIQQAILKVKAEELPTAESVHKWLFANGFKGDFIQSLHVAEQADASANNS